MRIAPPAQCWATSIWPLATALLPEEHDSRPNTVGRPVLHVMSRVVDTAMNDCKPGEHGEIVHRSPQLLREYWDKPAETTEVFAGEWFHSGDIGYMDERGYFKIVDRKKDMILVSGFNVYPNEVEEVASSCPGVLECAAIGIPDAEAGEAVKLVVVKKDPALTETQVREHCKDKLTGYKHPRTVEFRDELPKTPVGKILRRELRQPA